DRLPARREPAQNRRGHLRLHRQYPFLRHRYAAQAVRLLLRQSRAPLQRDPCGRDRAGARGAEVRMIEATSGPRRASIWPATLARRELSPRPGFLLEFTPGKRGGNERSFAVRATCLI